MKLFIALLLTSFSSFAADQYFCNGTRMNYGSDSLYPNSQRIKYAGDFYYPNGQVTEYAGDMFYPTGVRMNYAGEDFHITGQRVVYAGDLFYPNGQRVQYAGSCYYSTGVRMASCPATVNFISRSGKFRVFGTMSVKEKKILSQRYEHVDGNVISYFNVDGKGEIKDLEVLCE